jgi:hypothetical protein
MNKSLLLAIILLIPTVTQADTNNFLQLRFEAGSNQESGNGFFATRTLLENTSLGGWTLGSRIGTSQNRFSYVNPYALYKVNDKFKVGSTYMQDSFGNESVGPALRYTDVFGGQVFTMLEYSGYIDIHGNNNLHDLWWNISQNKKEGWKVGAEAWYYHYDEGTENLKLRPLKISYIFPKGITAFAMLQRHWNDKGTINDALLGGIEMKF